MNTEMENGTQLTLEEWMPEACPKQIAGVSGSHAKTSLWQESRPDSKDLVQVCFSQLQNLLETSSKKIDPSIYLLRTLKTFLVLMGGGDFLKLLLELDEIGYDAEWQVLNSKDFGVPQNRERVFIVGHLRGRCTTEIFPIEGTNGENCIHQIGMQENGRKNPNQYRVYDASGLAPTLNKMDGGGREPSIAQFCDLTYRGGLNTTENARTIQARYSKGASAHSGEVSGVAVPVLRIKEATKKGYAEAHEGDGINLTMPESKTRRGRVGGAIVNTLDTQCNQGTMVKVNDDKEVYAVWSDKYQTYIAIRRLTPKECFRLQAWPDKYFDRAAMVNSDSQLYKQAGNGVTCSVVAEIAKRMGDDEILQQNTAGGDVWNLHHNSVEEG